MRKLCGRHQFRFPIRISSMDGFATRLFAVLYLAIGAVAGLKVDACAAADAGTAVIIAQALPGKTKKPGTRSAYPRFPGKFPYTQAREDLLASGWQPVVSADADVCEAGDTRCEGRPEMEACAGTGEGNCLFVWRKDKIVIAVTTYDDPPLVASVRCRSGCRPNAAR
jgi:hypothetical protein